MLVMNAGEPAAAYATTGLHLLDVAHTFQVDGRSSASDRFATRVLARGAMLGLRHQFGQSRWSLRWALSADVAPSGWSGSTRLATTLRDPATQGWVVVPKVRLWLTFAF